MSEKVYIDDDQLEDTDNLGLDVTLVTYKNRPDVEYSVSLMFALDLIENAFENAYEEVPEELQNSLEVIKKGLNGYYDDSDDEEDD